MEAHRSAGFGLGLALLSAAHVRHVRHLRPVADRRPAGPPRPRSPARVGIAALVLAVPAAIALRGRWHVAAPQRRHARPVRAARGRRGAGRLLQRGPLPAGRRRAAARVPRHHPRRGLDVGRARPAAAPLTVAGAVAAMLGLVLVLDLTGGARLDPVGVLWGLVAAVGLAAYFVLVRAGRRRAAVRRPWPAAAWRSARSLLLLLGVVGVLPLHATFGDVHFAGHTTSWLVPMLGLSPGRGRRLLRRRHRRGPHPGRPAVLVRRADRGAVRGPDRLAGARRAADAGAAARRRAHRRRRRAGAPRRVAARPRRSRRGARAGAALTSGLGGFRRAGGFSARLRAHDPQGTPRP